MKLTHNVHGFYFLRFMFALLFWVVLIAMLNIKQTGLHGLVFASIIYFFFLRYDGEIKLAKWYQNMFNLRD